MEDCFNEQQNDALRRGASGGGHAGHGDVLSGCAGIGNRLDGGNFEIGLWLPAFVDVDAEYEKLKAKGVAVPADGPITLPFGIRNFYIADPEGNLLEIGSDTPN